MLDIGDNVRFYLSRQAKTRVSFFYYVETMCGNGKKKGICPCNMQITLISLSCPTLLYVGFNSCIL